MIRTEAMQKLERGYVIRNTQWEFSGCPGSGSSEKNDFSQRVNSIKDTLQGEWDRTSGYIKELIQISQAPRRANGLFALSLRAVTADVFFAIAKQSVRLLSISPVCGSKQNNKRAE